MEQNFQSMARSIVVGYFNQHKDVTDEYVMVFSDTYVVWFSKTLQNWKALVSTNVPDGVYYELTHDGAQERTYLDVYKKLDNVTIGDDGVFVTEEAIKAGNREEPEYENITPKEDAAWRVGKARI